MKKALFAFFLLWSGLGIRADAQPAWQVNPHEFEHSMMITATVTVQGKAVADPADLVAAFSNGVCRGKSNVTYDPGLKGWYVYLMVYSNASGELLTFTYYDASEKAILPLVNQVTFGVNQIVGSPDDPYRFTDLKTGVTSGSLPLNPGEADWDDRKEEVPGTDGGLSLWPNPCRGQFTFSTPGGQPVQVHYCLMTIDGQIVRSGESRQGVETRVNTGDLRSGTYVLMLQSERGVDTRCVLKE